MSPDPEVEDPQIKQITQIHLKFVFEPLKNGNRSTHTNISNPSPTPAQERNVRHLCNLRILNLFLA